MVRVETNDPTHHWALLAQGGLHNTRKLRNIARKKEKNGIHCKINAHYKFYCQTFKSK